MGAPDGARRVIDAEIASPIAVRHDKRLSFTDLPALQGRGTLLLIFGSPGEIHLAAQVLQPLLTTTVLVRRDDAFTYRELNDIVDLLGG